MRKVKLLIFVFTLTIGTQFLANCQSKDNTFADHWEFVGIAVEEPGYTIWGTSPIIGDDGKVHLFVARWPAELNVTPGWRTHSEIAHYVGDSPEGPFKFSDVALKGSIEKKEISEENSNPTNNKEKRWDEYAPHNPAIHKVDSLYVLLYIGNNGLKKHPRNQRIGMATSKSLFGPWKKVGKDGLILSPPDNPEYWNHNARNGVNNPALLQHPKGGYYLYFKSHRARMGLAVAENIEGPYVQMPFPVTSNNSNIEDGYAFIYDEKFALLTTDNHGMIEEGGGLLWTSEDGIHFNTYEKGFHHINDYTDVDMEKVAVYYGPKDREYAKFERPQVLLIDSKPQYLYVPSGTNIYGGNSTVSYVLRFKEHK
ncbi:MAG: glycoside hydrolase family protein [Bacteroidota bacterium]